MKNRSNSTESELQEKINKWQLKQHEVLFSNKYNNVEDKIRDLNELENDYKLIKKQVEDENDRSLRKRPEELKSHSNEFNNLTIEEKVERIKKLSQLVEEKKRAHELEKKKEWERLQRLEKETYAKIDAIRKEKMKEKT